jgi:hypothetical protein
MLLAGLALKLEPIIVTDVPAAPEEGEKVEIIGWEYANAEKAKTPAKKYTVLLMKSACL